MPYLTFKEKDDNITWSEIQQVIFQSHDSNRKKGVDIHNAHLSPEELENAVGIDGKCFVALDGEKVVGTCSVAFKERNVWYAKGRVAYLLLAAVHPNYKGQQIFTKLSDLRMKYIISSGCTTLYMNIAEHNYIRRSIAKKEGFSPVAINYNPYNPHNYITYCYWTGQRPCSKIIIMVRFCISMAKLYLRKIKRILVN